VSEGELQKVHNTEFTALREVCNKYEKEEEFIDLSIIGVMKQGNIRLQTLNNERVLNPPCGTVVDNDITQPGKLDFFLIAHSVNRGTARPTRYQVIHNEIQQDSDFYQVSVIDQVLYIE
jgi:eukaryotic translation initiation factor 2C